MKKYILLQSKNPEYLLTFNCATKNSKGSHFCHNIFIKDYKGNIAKIQYEYMINLHCYLKDKCPNGKKSAQCLVYSSRLKAKGSALDQGYSFSQTEWHRIENNFFFSKFVSAEKFEVVILILKSWTTTSMQLTNQILVNCMF